MKTFREFLAEKAQENWSATDRHSRRAEWIDAIDAFMGRLEGWLQESDPDRLLQVHRRIVERNEQNLGTYQATGLNIGLGDSVVKVTPIGRYVVGFIGPQGDIGERAAGRIDVSDEGSSRKYRIFRKAASEDWFVIDDAGNTEPLTRQKFESMLEDLLS